MLLPSVIPTIAVQMTQPRLPTQLLITNHIPSLPNFLMQQEGYRDSCMRVENIPLLLMQCICGVHGLRAGGQVELHR